MATLSRSTNVKVRYDGRTYVPANGDTNREMITGISKEGNICRQRSVIRDFYPSNMRKMSDKSIANWNKRLASGKQYIGGFKPISSVERLKKEMHSIMEKYSEVRNIHQNIKVKQEEYKPVLTPITIIKRRDRQVIL